MSSASVVPKLFQPIRVGDFTLSHRIVLAPLTRYRAHKNHVHSDLAIEYYAQRASVPGTLLVTEATFISEKAGGYNNVPGIWNDEQVTAWKRITDAIHEKGSRVFCQLWALGRAANPDVLRAEGPHDLVSASDIALAGHQPPRPLTIAEIKEYLETYATAARNAVRAGFDGVEIHSANGYLLDQFLQDVSNKRTDEYGGSIENRTRFALEVVDAISKAIGAPRVGIRISPWGQFQDMGMVDPRPTFSHLVRSIAQLHPNFAYLHLVEPRAHGNLDREVQEGESNDFLREIWSPRPFMSAGGYTRALAFEQSELSGDLIAFGRTFISNPDLPTRLAKDLPLARGDRDTYYIPETPKGFIDYPFSDDPRASL
ncbi:uncharacterized protein FIBRA_01915 [Fibroporia radiculosa]|uniref:NADH:flavin oxidoreductase/NADH oxidase N-terminal domain-containing protein n=1 Tax=Fibroporia radiculosa TaxID=599839 RepID=J4GLU6_9APHY|nr:uncharacterized protein FIBRA_01915 [Fibroporia radiculosa]CCL99890.1 predicted protein [Fibroporia radiculosa]